MQERHGWRIWKTCKRRDGRTGKVRICDSQQRVAGFFQSNLGIFNCTVASSAISRPNHPSICFAIVQVAHEVISRFHPTS